MSIPLRYFIDWRGSNFTPAKGNGSGKGNRTWRSILGENRLRACRIVELTEIRALRRAKVSDSAWARNARFHSCTRAGVTSASLTACTLASHLAQPPPGVVILLGAVRETKQVGHNLAKGLGVSFHGTAVGRRPHHRFE